MILNSLQLLIFVPERAENSPKPDLPTRKRAASSAKTLLNLSSLNSSGGKVAKSSAAATVSPAVQRWRKAFKALTPEILKKARQAR